MAEYIEIDGVLIDPDTGEIYEFPHGSDRLAWLASQIVASQEQEKAWSRSVGALKAAAMALIPDRKAICGDVVLSLRSRVDKVQDVAAIREWVADAGLPAAELLDLALAAKGFDTGLLASPVAEGIVRACTTLRPSRSWLIAEKVRKPAPRVVERDAVGVGE